MKTRTGIITAFILCLAIAGSAFGATVNLTNNKPKTAVATNKVKPKTKHRKHRKGKRTLKTKTVKSSTSTKGK